MRSSVQVRARRVAPFAAAFFAVIALAQTPPDFTGHWRQQTNSKEQRLLDIEQREDSLRVTTTQTTSKGARRLEVKYRIGGPETVYKGLDGDTFHTQVHWDGSTLVFETVEHERGKKLPETTVWTLSEDRNNIQWKRNSAKSGKNSTTTYVRQP